MCYLIQSWSCFIRGDFYDNDPSLPVYQWNHANEHYSLAKLAQILLTDLVPPRKWCSKQPVYVQRNVSFVVNISHLDDPTDIRADENGVWIRKGSPVAYVSKLTKADTTLFFHRSKAGHNHYKITRTYYRHSSSPDFKRIITIVHSKGIVYLC